MATVGGEPGDGDAGWADDQAEPSRAGPERDPGECDDRRFGRGMKALAASEAALDASLRAIRAVCPAQP